MSGNIREIFKKLEELSLKNREEFFDYAFDAIKSETDPKNICLIKAFINSQSNTEIALKFIEEALKHDPSCPISLQFKAEILSELYKFNEAKEVIQQLLLVVEEPIDKFYAYLTYAGILISGEEALEYCDRAIAINPESYLGYFYKAQIYALNPNERETQLQALQIINKSLEKEISLEAYLLKAKIFENLGYSEIQILECYSEAAALAPKSFEVWSAKGNYYEQKGELETKFLDNALECFDKAIKHNPTKSHVWESRAKILSNKENYQKADECFENLILLSNADEKIKFLSQKIQNYLKMYANQEGKKLSLDESLLCLEIPQALSTHLKIKSFQLLGLYPQIGLFNNQGLTESIQQQFAHRLKTDYKIATVIIYETLFTLEPTNPEFLENYVNVLKEIDPLKAKRVLYNNEPTNALYLVDYITALKVTDLAKAKRICLSKYKEHAELKTPEVQKLLINLIVEEARIKGRTPSLYAFAAQRLVNDPNQVVSELSEVTEKIINQAEQKFRHVAETKQTNNINLKMC
ncbi:MAG: tetratricopeptide repeat protein [Sphingobacteriia bacterium]|nr:tetratricopeptide repeat protein [Sphingobacteriia bacterium]